MLPWHHTFVMIFFANNKERVPFTQEKVSIKDSLKVVFGNKNLLMVSLTKFTGFGRGVYGTVSLYIAVYLLGSKDLKLALLLPMGIGTAVGTLLVNFVLKNSQQKQLSFFSVYTALHHLLSFILFQALSDSRKSLLFRSLSSTSSAEFSTVTQTQRLTS